MSDAETTPESPAAPPPLCGHQGHAEPVPAALAVHLPAIRNALSIAISEAVYEAEAAPFRAALEALSGAEGATGHG
jgi:hypothetical protein